MIQKIEERFNGAVDAVFELRSERSVSRWASLPGRTRIDNQTREKIKTFIELSGISPKELLSRARDIPVGLNARVVSGWLSEEKPTQTAYQASLNFVLTEYKRQMSQDRTLKYLREGVKELLDRGAFDYENKFPFRKTQKEALEAYQIFLDNPDISDEDKLQGFFEMPTGVGKTAVFIGLVTSAHKAAERNGETLNTLILVPKNTLLEQTYEAFSDFGPDFSKAIGLYGDGHKDLSNPITIMTYEAWSTLSEEDKIGMRNVDILISDEAHRGTSDLRSGHLEDKFGEATLRLAFTATAHFDEEKSVEATHKNQIYYKSLTDAVRDNELADYISAQLYLIRVEPPKLGTEFYWSMQNTKGTKVQMRRHAWCKRAMCIFTEGRDKITGDLLSDNQTGFFVEGISQANELEGMLNSNPVLKKRAAEQGYEQSNASA